jgi:biopolymer transport protein ExbD
MNFQRGQKKEEPEINLVPMIDVLLVILIFLVITTTYSKFSELEITLPQAATVETDITPDSPKVIDVSINAKGDYTINLIPTKFTSIESLRDALQAAAETQENPIIIINADAKATHQSVITIMEAARLAGYNQVTFTTEITDNNK